MARYDWGRFQAIWNRARDLDDVVREAGVTANTARVRACRMRKAGVRMKKMRSGPKAEARLPPAPEAPGRLSADAEFIDTWNSCSTIDEVALIEGTTRREVVARKRALRGCGWDLKDMRATASGRKPWDPLRDARKNRPGIMHLLKRGLTLRAVSETVGIPPDKIAAVVPLDRIVPRLFDEGEPIELIAAKLKVDRLKIAEVIREWLRKGRPRPWTVPWPP